MNIFIDGFQNVGKTTLIKESGFKNFRFPFDVYAKDFELNNKDLLNGFQIGKDLGILFALSSIESKEKVLFDRGPISSLYYSLLENRMSKSQLKSFIKHIKTFKNSTFIFIKKINDNSGIIRNHNDGFDYLSKLDQKAEQTFQELMSLLVEEGIGVEIFVNDFSLPITENIKKFKERIDQIK